MAVRFSCASTLLRTTHESFRRLNELIAEREKIRPCEEAKSGAQKCFLHEISYPGVTTYQRLARNVLLRISLKVCVASVCVGPQRMLFYLYNAAFNGGDDRLGTIGNFQFAEDVFHVELHRALNDLDRGSDFLIAQSFRDQAKDVELSR